MRSDAGEHAGGSVEDQAAAWFARLRGPGGDTARPAFDAWIKEDPARQRAYDDLLLHWDRAKFLTNTPLGRSRSLDSVSVWYRRSPARLAIAMLAVCLIVGSLAVLYGRLAPAAPTTIAFSTGVGELKTVALADGTQMTLDGGSKVEIAFDSTARRTRMIEGAARFSVRPDPSRPFTVGTSRGTVRLDSGVFDLLQSSGLVRISALRGTLAIKPDGPSTAWLAINPGERIVFAAGRAGGAASRSTPGASDWTKGMLAFDGDRLSDAIEQMNRHNRRKIILTDPPLGDLKVTGAFRATDPEGFARAVAEMLGLAVQAGSDGTLALSRKK